MSNFSLFRAGFFFLTLVQIVFSLGDHRYEACKPRSCGNNLTNLISYPFWIHEEYCGIPEFKVTCKQGEPIINALGVDYIIKHINYTEQSFRVQNSVVLEKKSCPIPLKNYTFDKSSPFQFGPNVYNLSFFYNCAKQFDLENLTWYSVDCDKSSNLSSLALFNVVPGNPTIVQKVVKLCKSWVLTPVEFYKDNPSTSGIRNYTVFMEQGFMLKYSVKKRCTECRASAGFCGFENGELKCFCVDQPYNKTCNDTKSITVPPPPKRNIERKVKIGIGAGIGGCVLTGLVVLLIVYCRRRRKRYLDKSSGLISSRNVSPDFSMMPDQEKGFLAPIFSYKELEEATNNFDDAKELGDGGFGTVYHGELKDGRVVAVKRLYENNGKRVEQFMNEVQILSRLRHKNLVILYGCTSRHSRELLLVYEFVPNGTVADHLHGERAGSGLVPWPVRMNIAIETADALKYLHVSEIIHRDVKTNNILLDENFHVKVADFGLSRLFPTDVTHVSTAPQGTPGYVDPEYYQCYQLTSKSDVYSFGVVLVELISSKPAVDISRHRHEINLSNLAINKIHNHALHELIDPSLGFETDSSVKKMITLVAELAFRCLQQDSDMRPSMTEVLEVLKEIENEGSKKAKGVEIDIAADDIGLLKNNISPFSPDSVTQRWDSDITPNTSS